MALAAILVVMPYGSKAVMLKIAVDQVAPALYPNELNEVVGELYPPRS